MEFTEIAPAADCACPGCAARRRTDGPPGHPGHPERGRHRRRTARAARRAAALLAAAGTVIGGASSALAESAPWPGGGTSASDSPDAPEAAAAPDTPQGEAAGLFGAALLGPHPRSTPATSRSAILDRAQSWVDQQVPYSMSGFWSDGYRQDCSGFVSMAWGLGSSQTTWTLPDFADRIAKNDLQPGDALIFNDPDHPQGGSHIALFAGWADSSRTTYLAFEQTRPNTRKRSTPYAYWSHADGYLPYRYRGLSGSSDSFPGADKFGPGARNEYVGRLGQLLVGRGGGRFYAEGPDDSWDDADHRATEAFQLAQGWTGTEADGYPGKDTWDYLTHHRGSDIPPA
ncbi:peptidoglycan-binding protein [Kitasatospora sp. NPDC056138]|uniref:peptidoglycan-binding protein n=1 Tax=Kitasatospora sp. NPDC056138 TaxID=3345724 RepID=UPI0035D9B4FD